jgi:Ca-activated chloride channel family protein
MRKISLSFLPAAVLLATILTTGCGPSVPPITIISGSENRTLEPILHDFERKHNTRISMEYKGSVDIMMELEGGTLEYDAVWPANSLWIALGDRNRRVKHSTSIMTSPVVFGIRQGLAEELGFVDTTVRVADILEAIEGGKLSFMMTSATQSNSGASAYFGFLYALTGNPEVLTPEHLHSEELRPQIRSILGGIHRSSGSSGWLKELFVDSNYDAMVNYEALIIEANRELIAQGKEPLYVVYPVDGIVMADSPLGFVDQGAPGKEDTFLKLQEYLLSPEVQEKITALGRRTGIGGTAGEVDPEVFNPRWGIDTERLLSPIKIPSAEVISEALNLYQTVFRKPSLTIFCLDYSGSMEEGGMEELKDAMRTLLDQEEAKKYLIQTGEEDITIVLPFSSTVLDLWAVEGNDPGELSNLLQTIVDFPPGGATDIYTPVITGLNIISEFNDYTSYIPAIILMTDGESNEGRSYSHLLNAWNTYTVDVPVFSIMFGMAVESQLEQISSLTRGRVFDGKHDLVKTFRTAKGYN